MVLKIISPGCGVWTSLVLFFGIGLTLRTDVFLGKSGPYKTPFERKKEQEIIKLDKKIEKANANICSQKQDLKEMQEDIREQQLSVLRQQVR